MTKPTAARRLAKLIAPLTAGFFRDNNWVAPGSVFEAITAAGGEVDIRSADYINGGGAKRWMLGISFGGFSFNSNLTACFADRPNGDVYDLCFVVGS